MKEYEFYQKRKNWNFSDINYHTECLTDWNMYEILRSNTNPSSKVLDLGTGGGEKVIKHFPEVEEIIATDYSEEMIKTAKENLIKSGRKNITFKVMDNLNMQVPKDYFDVVLARHTVTDPKQLYKALKKNGLLIIRGVDKLDCWQLKRVFDKGQGYSDVKPISVVDYEAVLDAGFKDVELVPIYGREYYATKEDLIMFLQKVPIFDDFSETMQQEDSKEKIDEYVNENTYDKGVLIRRRYYGITARKRV